MFDGSELEGSSLITAAVGASGRLEAPMAGLPPSYWPIQLAFFKADDPGALPQYEMSMNQHANGVASVITMDYGDFKFRMSLVGLEDATAILLISGFRPRPHYPRRDRSPRPGRSAATATCAWRCRQGRAP